MKPEGISFDFFRFQLGKSLPSLMKPGWVYPAMNPIQPAFSYGFSYSLGVARSNFMEESQVLWMYDPLG